MVTDTTRLKAWLNDEAERKRDIVIGELFFLSLFLIVLAFSIAERG